MLCFWNLYKWSDFSRYFYWYCWWQSSIPMCTDVVHWFSLLLTFRCVIVQQFSYLFFSWWTFGSLLVFWLVQTFISYTCPLLHMSKSGIAKQIAYFLNFMKNAICFSLNFRQIWEWKNVLQISGLKI